MTFQQVNDLAGKRGYVDMLHSPENEVMYFKKGKVYLKVFPDSECFEIYLIIEGSVRLTTQEQFDFNNDEQFNKAETLLMHIAKNLEMF